MCPIANSPDDISYVDPATEPAFSPIVPILPSSTQSDGRATPVD
jgi:hypothetical protein